MLKAQANITVFIIAAAVALLLSREAFTGELGTDFMLDLWKYRTGEEDTGLLTGRPSRKMPDAPSVVFASVSGSIECLQHLALRPNDVIDVALLDFAARDAAAIIAGQKITSPGQIPIPFKLTYDPARINPAHHYTVQTRIMRNGEPAFINSAPCFVITHGYSNTARVIVEQTKNTLPSPAGKEPY
jgi:putative lipoprotein